MNITFKIQANASSNDVVCILGNNIPSYIKITSEGAKALKKKLAGWQNFRTLSENDKTYILIKTSGNSSKDSESIRKKGAALYQFMKENDVRSCFVYADSSKHAVHLAEGLALSNYRFENYKANQDPFELKSISFRKGSIDAKELKNLENRLKAVYLSRDLVNEPANTLTPIEMAERIKAASKAFGFKAEIFGKKKIASLRMGGLLAVNQGSAIEPTFSILDHSPKSFMKTIVLVGKGITYDTGGLSLKPTPNSMDIMKCDMGGAAAVIGAVSAVAAADLPFRVVGLIPATDNQPGPNAYQPGDVIKMYSGLQVEVMNTDAEGRLAMADALAYAKKYDPDLVIDVATLTGSAIRALGLKAAAVMGTAPQKVIDQIKDAGMNTWERLVQFPLWDDYDEDLKSDIADSRNLGPTPYADVMIAGKFLQKFTDYPWMHIDIAGPAFLPAANGYLPKGGSGFGVNLLYHFIKDLKI